MIAKKKLDDEFAGVDFGGASRELARRHLADFTRYMWPVLEPHVPLVWDWPLDAICAHLEAVSDGRIKNIAINCPPRSLKSTLVSVMWPAWEWLHKPHLKYLTASYDSSLAMRDAVFSRRLMQSDEYQALRPGWKFQGDQNVKSWYENDRGGHRITTSPESSGTGHGANRVIIDDPLSARDAYSPEAIQRANMWHDETMSTRRNDAAVDAEIIMAQRLSLDDMTGHVLKRKAVVFDHLCLPLLYESDHPTPTRSSIGFRDPRTKDGLILMPKRITPELVAEFQESLGTWGFASQMQQRPGKLGGNILDVSKLRRWTTLPPLDKADMIFTSWDCKFGGTSDGKQTNPSAKKVSWVVGQLWATFGSNSFLLDQVRALWDFVATIEQMKAMRLANRHASAHVVENKANGPALESVLRSAIPGLLLVEPRGNKVQRAMAISPMIEAGNVWIPADRQGYPWVDGLLAEFDAFPNAGTDDQVDAASQGLIYAHVDGATKAIDRLDMFVKALRSGTYGR